jgi:hypothetical protein
MPICGDLSTMSLVELLRWASHGQHTGVLEVEVLRSLEQMIDKGIIRIDRPDRDTRSDEAETSSEQASVS